MYKKSDLTTIKACQRVLTNHKVNCGTLSRLNKCESRSYTLIASCLLKYLSLPSFKSPAQSAEENVGIYISANNWYVPLYTISTFLQKA